MMINRLEGNVCEKDKGACYSLGAEEASRLFLVDNGLQGLCLFVVVIALNTHPGSTANDNGATSLAGASVSSSTKGIGRSCMETMGKQARFELQGDDGGKMCVTVNNTLVRMARGSGTYMCHSNLLFHRELGSR